MKFINNNIKRLVPYVYGEQPAPVKGIIKLNTNENPYPPHRSVSTLLKKFDPDKLRYYPDPVFTNLKKAAAAALQIPGENIIFGNGSDELIALIFKIFFNKEDNALFTEYTYSAYKTYADAAGVKYNYLPMEGDFRINLDLLQKFTNKVVFITNPNAPTGLALEPLELESCLMTYSNKLFIIDEAYTDFYGKSCISFAVKHQNVIVLRTMSKAFSMCGSRLGYAVACSEIIDAFYKVKDPYNVNCLTQLIGEQTFKNYNYYLKNISRVVKVRDVFTVKLKKLDFEVVPSMANYVLVKPPETTAEALFSFLKKNKIYVRYFAVPLLKDYLRISIGTPLQMERVYNVIKKYYHK